MSQRTKDKLRGFVVPFPFTTDDVWSSQSTFTQLDTFADYPEPQQESKMFLGAIGECADVTDIQIKTSKAGVPSTAEFTIKDNNSTGSNPDCGSQPKVLITDFVIPNVEDSTNQFFNFDQLTFDDGSILTAVEHKSTITGLKIKVSKHTRTGTLSTTSINVGAFATFGSRGKPALCELEDGSILLLISTVDEDDKMQINVHRSIDNGSNFTLVSKQALKEPVDVDSSTGYQIQQMRARSLNGQTVLFISVFSNNSSDTNKNHVYQYCSVDGGGTFIKVTKESEIDSFPFYKIDCFVYQNQICIVYIAATNELHLMKVTHGFYSVHALRTASKFNIIITGSANDYASGTNTTMQDGAITAHVDYSGAIFVYAQENSDSCIVSFYSENSEDWTAQTTVGTPSRNGNVFFVDSNTNFDSLKSNTYKGGVILCSKHDGTNDDSTCFLILGGYSNVTYGFAKIRTIQNPIFRMHSSFCYLPILLPSTSSQLGTAGTGTESIASGSDFLDVQVTSAQLSKTYTRTSTASTNFDSITVRGVLDVVSNGSGATLAPVIIEIKTERSGSGQDHTVRCEFFTNSIQVTDESGSSPVSMVNQSFDCTAGVEFIVTIFGGKAGFWYRQKSSFTTLREFIEGARGFALANNPTGSTSQTVFKFGIEGSPTLGTAQAKFYQLNVCDNLPLGDISEFQSSDLIGAIFPSSSNYIYGVAGVSFFASGATTYIGEEWKTTATSQSSINNIFHSVSPSPRVKWRSQSVSSGAALPAQRIALQLATNNTDLMNDVIGFHLSGLNFKDAQLQYWNGSSWITFQTFSTSEGLEHGFLKQGRTIKQDASNLIDDNYYFHNELKGYVAMLVSGETTEFKRVVSNSEGVFGNNNNTKKCVILLDSEPSLSSGTVHLIPDQMTLIAPLNGVDGSAWALNIPSQSTIDDEYRIGMMVLGSVVIAGRQYSKGRRISIESGTITSTTPDRTVFSKALAPEQRTVEISWSDGVDQSALYSSDPDPDFFKVSSAVGSEPVAVYEDAPFLMEGILRELKGNNAPCIYLPSINTNNTVQILNRRDRHMLSLINSDISIDSITGEELGSDGIGEVFRVSSISLLEIV